MSSKAAVIRYLGSKSQMVEKISERLHATGKTCLVDVFGGSGAVTIHSGFKKRVYNDINGDLVNFFEVLASQYLRPKLFKQLKWYPPSREIFDKDYNTFLEGNLSFRNMRDKVDRARATFYRARYCFGGKYRSGGFGMSVSGRPQIKEIQGYRSALKELAVIGQVFRETVIENLDFREIIKRYGEKEDVIFFADPPYPGYTYYPRELSENDHRKLAEVLEQTRAPVVCTFYGVPFIREIYSEDNWTFETLIKKKTGLGYKMSPVEELILIKRLDVDIEKPLQARQMEL